MDPSMVDRARSRSFNSALVGPFPPEAFDVVAELFEADAVLEVGAF